jgi:hypothetical protein
VTVGEHRDNDRTVVKERAPERKTVIKKDSDGNREKTVTHHDN